MIIVKRSDGTSLVLDSAISMRNVPAGVVVEYPSGEFFLIEDWSIADIEKYATTQYRNLVVLLREWRGWPQL